MENNDYRVDYINIKRKRYWLDFFFTSHYVLMIDDIKRGTLKSGQSLNLKVRHGESHIFSIEILYRIRLFAKVIGPRSKKFYIKNTSTNNLILEIGHSRKFILITNLLIFSSLPLLGLSYYYLDYWGAYLWIVVFIIFIKFVRKIKSKNIAIKTVSE